MFYLLLFFCVWYPGETKTWCRPLVTHLCVAVAENKGEREKDWIHHNNQKLLSAGAHERSVSSGALVQDEQLRVGSLFVSHKGDCQQS